MTRIALSPVTAVACDSEFRVIDDAAIHIEAGAITYIGSRTQAPPFQPDEQIGGPHLVAVPGLINTHTHTGMTLLRGYADDMALEPWLHTKIWPFEAHLTGDDVYWGTMLAICEMLRGGTTCFADMYHFYERGVEAMIETGIRACPAAVLLGFLPEPERRIANGLAFVREFNGAGNGRITPFVGPHSLYTCNREQWRALIEGARDIGVPIHTHVAETKREVEEVTAAWGAPPVETLEKIGALDGPLVAAHCVYLSEHEQEIVRRHRDNAGATHFRVAHNPTSNLKLASGIAPVPRYLEAGITVGLGPDGTASNNRLDMWHEMRLAALLHKATTGDPTVISARQALCMATIEGARCLNLADSIGSLELGKRADITILDFDKPHLYPCHNVVSQLVYAAGAADVDTVLVDGQIRVRGSRFRQIDVARVCAMAAAAAARLAGCAGV